MSAEVVEFGPHTRMTPEEALTLCSREEWDEVIIIGYRKDSPDFATRSSHMSRECALWLVEHAKMHVLGLSQEGAE